MPYEQWREDILWQMAEELPRCMGKWWMGEFLQLYPWESRFSRHYKWSREYPFDFSPCEPWREDWLIKMADEAKIDLGDWFYKRYLLPSYAGATWYDYYRGLAGRSRDSGELEESNFQVACERLEAIEEEGENWQIVHEGHWAVGWVEWIAIHKDAKRLLHEAARIREALEDYAILDESHYSELCFDNYVQCVKSEFGNDKEGAQIYFDRAREEDLDDCDCDSINWDVIEEIKNREEENEGDETT